MSKKEKIINIWYQLNQNCSYLLFIGARGGGNANEQQCQWVIFNLWNKTEKTCFVGAGLQISFHLKYEDAFEENIFGEGKKIIENKELLSQEKIFIETIEMWKDGQFSYISNVGPILNPSDRFNYD